MRYFLSFVVLIFLSGCSRPDFDSSVQVESWLRSLDPNAELIEVRCTGNVEEPPGSGIWKEWKHTDKWTAKDVLAVYANEGLDWEDIVARAISAAQVEFPRVALGQASEGLTAIQRIMLKMSFRVEDVSCDGNPLRSPSIQIGKCPNDTNGCDEPPTTTDLPPPLPPPPGGGDF